MRLLAFETATEACSVALWIDGDVRERFEIAPRRHAELALPWADALLAGAGIARRELDAIAVGRGPGAFTGVRLAVAIAQGIALALDRPVLPVSTLAALAMQGEEDRSRTIGSRSNERPNAAREGRNEEDRVLAAIDARMGEIYLGEFARDADGLVAPLRDERLARPDAVDFPDDGNWIGIGTGFAAEKGALVKALGSRLTRCEPDALPHAAAVAKLAARAFASGEAVAPERVEPAYLRDQVALTLAEQQASRR
jgi:tRNA threonylcarbamoyladenosine biosynthesis protein TsaB